VEGSRRPGNETFSTLEPSIETSVSADEANIV
jgi:hypothetical protein